MGKLLEELGVNWKLLASQAINFLILLFILKTFIYKPVLQIIEKRKAKIEEGLAKSEEADFRLKEVDNICKENLKKAEKESVSLMESAHVRAKDKEYELVKTAENYQKEMMDKADIMLKKQQEEAREAVLREAVEMVKRVIVKTVELDPYKIDEALIKKAASEIKTTVK
ncbi:MAG: hypothetical protein Q8N69_01795 [bacterium]|nr:hypothetical protein [bacterium]